MSGQHDLAQALSWLRDELDEWAQDIECQRYKGDVRFVARDLLELCQKGEPFTSHKQLARRLDCPVEAIREGLWWYEKLKAWAGIREDAQRPLTLARKKVITASSLKAPLSP